MHFVWCECQEARKNKQPMTTMLKPLYKINISWRVMANRCCYAENEYEEPSGQGLERVKRRVERKGEGVERGLTPTNTHAHTSRHQYTQEHRHTDACTHTSTNTQRHTRTQIRRDTGSDHGFERGREKRCWRSGRRRRKKEAFLLLVRKSLLDSSIPPTYTSTLTHTHTNTYTYGRRSEHE